MADSNVCLKLLINSQTNKVLFAEAGKDSVDFLCNILSLPIATIIRLLKEQGMVGCLGNLYESIECLDEEYIQPNQHKDSLLKPNVVSSVPLSLPEGVVKRASTGKVLYACNDCMRYYSDNLQVFCPSCCYHMSTAISYVAAPGVSVKVSTEDGFVKGLVTYMVMDDLVIKPMSTISSITLLNTFNVKEVGALKEKVVTIGMKEAVKMLKTSLHSKNVLTEVFLGNTKLA